MNECFFLQPHHEAPALPRASPVLMVFGERTRNLRLEVSKNLWKESLCSGCGFISALPLLCIHPDPRTPAVKGADLGTVPRTCHLLDELQQGLSRGPHPDHSAETAPRAGAWRKETPVLGGRRWSPLEGDLCWEPQRTGRDGV